MSHARDGGFGDSFRRRITDAPHGSFVVHPQCDAAEFLEAITDVLPQWEQERVGGVAAVAREACFGMVLRSLGEFLRILANLGEFRRILAIFCESLLI